MLFISGASAGAVAGDGVQLAIILCYLLYSTVFFSSMQIIDFFIPFCLFALKIRRNIYNFHT